MLDDKVVILATPTKTH